MSRRIKHGCAALLTVLLLCTLLPSAALAAEKPYIRQISQGHIGAAVTSEGDLYAWGPTAHGLFGSVPDKTLGWTPLKSPKLVMQGVKQVAVATTPSVLDQGNLIEPRSYGQVILAVKENGDLYGNGDNSLYQMGQGYNKDLLDETDMDWMYIMSDVREAVCSGSACAAITENDDCYFWGMNIGYPLQKFYYRPVKIASDVKQVGMGREHVVLLKNDGTVWAMGTMHYGGDIGGDFSTLHKISSGCKAVAAGDGFTLLLKNDGTLYGYGNAAFGVFGKYFDTSKGNFVSTPMKLATDVRAIAASKDTHYFIKNDNTLWSMGSNAMGQRGPRHYIVGPDGTNWTDPQPTKLDDDVHSVAPGMYTAAWLKYDGTMWGCGLDAQRYQLGQGSQYGQIVTVYGITDRTRYIYYPVKCALSADKYEGMFGPLGFFRDVHEGMYYTDPVEWAVDEDITTGTGNGTFSPELTCTRGQIITFLWRAAGSPEPKNAAPFSDVKADAYYARATSWAAEKGLASGTTFDPDAPCTRLMAVEFMWNYAGSPSAPKASFTDVSSGAVNWAVKRGVTSGTGGSSFSPELTCTRAQIVTFLYRGFAR